MKIRSLQQTGIVVWGTGERSSIFTRNTNIPILYYIDNDKSRCESTFFDKKVIHPTEIVDLQQNYIVIANSFYDDIKLQLEGLGLRENENFIYYEKIEDNDVKLNKLLHELKISVEQFKANYSIYKGANLIFGSMVGFEPNCIKLFNEAFWEISKEEKFIMLAETHVIRERAREGKIGFPFFELPTFLVQNFHLKQNIFSEIEVEKSIVDYVEKENYRVVAVVDFEAKYENIAKGYANIFIYYADQYIREVIEYIKPKRVLMWNEFYPFHHLLSHICKEKGIDTIYMEFGGLPGTYIFDRMGQMGESYPATQWEKFKKLEITLEDRNNALEVREYLYKSAINRKPQPQSNELEAAKSRINPEWPIVVYMGQNDYESGLYPYTERTKNYHSPIFKSSDEAAVYLAKLAKKNNWNFIYKPHPICVADGKDSVEGKLPENVIFIRKCNINELVELADLNITILSTTAYTSLIRRKPILMLGYTQLRHKGCTYEAFEEDIIESEIKKALKQGYTEEQEEAFIEHIARELKYYAYDDEKDRPIRFGKNFRELLHYNTEQKIW